MPSGNNATPPHVSAVTESLLNKAQIQFSEAISLKTRANKLLLNLMVEARKEEEINNIANETFKIIRSEEALVKNSNPNY